MALHLIKLSVGSESVESLQAWIAFKLRDRRAKGLAEEHIHMTRMVPKRRAELIDGGSIYWVIKGAVLARSKLIDIRPFTDTDGIGRCHLVMEPVLVPTVPQPRRPFQGWRYLRGQDAPRDLPRAAANGDLPADMQRELLELGLL